MAELFPDRGYQLVIGAKFDGINYTYLFLDTCTEKRISGSARIPTQPLQDGNTMADHMYREPDEFTVSGSFSLYGANSGILYNDVPGIGDTGDRLQNIETVFEYIKDSGILCDLTTINWAKDKSTRFKQRSKPSGHVVSFSVGESATSAPRPSTPVPSMTIIFRSFSSNALPTVGLR